MPAIVIPTRSRRHFGHREFVQDSNPNAQDQSAQILTAEGPGAVAPGDTGVWRMIYDATDGSQSVDGLSLAIFYDSSVVRIADVTGVQSFSGASLASPSNDAFNLDLDASTDTYIEANWSPSALPWTETLPERSASSHWSHSAALNQVQP